jgi:hypothetical protein
VLQAQHVIRASHRLAVQFCHPDVNHLSSY